MITQEQWQAQKNLIVQLAEEHRALVAQAKEKHEELLRENAVFVKMDSEYDATASQDIQAE